MGNLKVGGKPWQPLQSFRTDSWDWPESEDPMEAVLDRAQMRALQRDAHQRLAFRRAEEARLAGELLNQRDMRMGRKIVEAGQSAENDEKPEVEEEPAGE